LDNSSLKGDAVTLLTEELQAKFNAYVEFDPNAPDYAAMAKEFDDAVNAFPKTNVDETYMTQLGELNFAYQELPDQAKALVTKLNDLALAAEAVYMATALADHPDDPAKAKLSNEQWETLQENLSNLYSGGSFAMLSEENQAKFNAYVSFDYTAHVVVYGDVDGDGKISAADALEVLKAVVGNVTLTEEQTIVADVDGDNRISAADALDILKKVVGKIDQFPVEE
ncbi:MAG: dockerin type I repeat-containing protein, partial [Clostridia bacterium]|nr:dockerin type I repeat-containing protein [Clostridia bacterium]